MAHRFLLLSLLSLFVCHSLASEMHAKSTAQDPVVRGRRELGGVVTNTCASQQRTLKRRVAMALLGAGVGDISSDKIVAYELNFLTAYNKLRRALCGGNPSLTVTAVKFVDDSTSPMADFIARDLKLVFQITFKCKWCNGNTTLFQNNASTRRLTAEEESDRINAIEEDDPDDTAGLHVDPALTDTLLTVGSRNLKKARSMCKQCRLLTPERFTLRFNAALKDATKKTAKKNAKQRRAPKSNVMQNRSGGVTIKLLPAWKWSELYRAPCSNVVDNLETSFIIPFTADPSKTITSEGLAILARGVVETINSFYVLPDGSCDLKSRVAISANAEVLTNGIPNRRSLATTTTSLKITVNYQCSGCSGGTALLKNDAPKRRRHLAFGSHGVNARRSLAVTTGYASACYCPVGAKDFEEPTRSEFDTAYNKTVSLLITRGMINFVTSVGKISEVVEFDCSPPEDARKTGLILRVCRGANVLSTNDQRVVADATETALNELVAKSCDQGSLAITDVQFVETLTTNGGGCAGTRYSYVVDFKCRDCPLDSKLLSDSPPRRALEEWILESRDNGMSRHFIRIG